MPRVKNPGLVNEHGVRIPEPKVNKLKKVFNSYNQKVDKAYRQLVDRGISNKVARMIAGENLSLNFDAFKTQKSIDRVIKSMQFRTTTAYRVQAREHITNSLLAFLEQRVGIGAQTLRRFEANFRRMTMKEYYQWMSDNWERLDELFESYKKGILNAMYLEDESRAILERFTRRMSRWRMPRDIYK